jgi:cation:H+ antiporter
MDYVLVLGGIALLIISGDWLVKAGSALAAYFRIPPIIVGVTIISFGTSAPELFVSVSASINGFSDVAIGNVVGSNIANIGLVLAVSAVIVAIPIQWSTIKLDFPVMILSAILFLFFAMDLEISRIEGTILLLVMLVYILFIIRTLRKNKKSEEKQIVEVKYKPIVSILLIIISCSGLVLGSQFLVDGSVNIATKFGISERIISLTVVAIGTSLPELTTSIIAAFKRNLDIAAGNVIGSNIFNTLVILGTSALIKPLSINPSVMQIDIWFMIGFAVLLGLFFMPLKRPRISGWEGLVFLLAYVGYYVVLFW